MLISLLQWNNFTAVGYSVYLYGNAKIKIFPVNAMRACGEWSYNSFHSHLWH